MVRLAFERNKQSGNGDTGDRNLADPNELAGTCFESSPGSFRPARESGPVVVLEGESPPSAGRSARTRWIGGDSGRWADEQGLSVPGTVTWVRSEHHAVRVEHFTETLELSKSRVDRRCRLARVVRVVAQMSRDRHFCRQATRVFRKRWWGCGTGTW